ncbi:hypothetical protein [Hyalangium rubrum]|uniref:Lipoprotein n=1 Tax=Hyalangium rubrum TaxID=3103134 RepID=A0ABU5H5T9_9BACT|nr:hypothetical protein [Hyalangium sp. s54d21]MDY7228844.1 hypothetical protein [Hyalangium sp. s54d21]
MRIRARGRLALLVLLLSSPAALGAPPRDDWFSADKRNHFLISMGLAGVGYGAGAALSEERPVRWLTGAGLSLGVGLGKELHDRSQGRLFSVKDLAWDAAGAAVGLGLAWLIDSLLSERAPRAVQQRRGGADGGWKPGPCPPRTQGTSEAVTLLLCVAR